MIKNGAKFLQRRLYSYVSTWAGFTVFLMLSYFLIATLISSLSNSCSLRGLHSHCSLRHANDNIAFRNLEGELSYEAFDVVYTWVNGSDPVWKAKKDMWSSRSKKMDHVGDGNAAYATANHTETLLNHNHTGNFTHSLTELMNITTISFNESATVAVEEEEANEAESLNRYRDSEELRFSLRSLVKNAPWIRHIYIVTDNQVPYWLNLESTRLTVVPHEEIFQNKSHLPVFSSPAIEANLHRIPGLSKKFIYFNDDVFLGARTLPEDFISMRGAQKLVMSWDVPKCAPGCSDTWIGDGFCDKACNVSACNFDFPDCINGSNANPSGSGGGTSRASSSLAMCNKGCPDNWLADKICDQRCKNAECGFDVGDCGLDLVSLNYPSVAIDASNARLQAMSTYGGTEYGPAVGSYQYGDSAMFGSGHADADPSEFLSLEQISEEFLSETSNATLGALDAIADARNGTEPTDLESAALSRGFGAAVGAGKLAQKYYPALTVEYGTNAVYFDLAPLACMYSLNATCIPENVNHVLYDKAEHDDEDGLAVHSTTLLTRHHVLVVLLYHGQDGALPFVQPSLDVKFAVTVNNIANAETTTATFYLRVLAQGTSKIAHPLELVPPGMALLSNQSFVHQSGVEEKPSPVLNLHQHDMVLLAHPYRTVTKAEETAASSKAGVEEGIIVSSAVDVYGSSLDLARTDCRELVLSYVITEASGAADRTALNLCDAVLIFRQAEEEKEKEEDAAPAFVSYSTGTGLHRTAAAPARSVQEVLSSAAKSAAAFAAYVSSKESPRSPRFLPPSMEPDADNNAGGVLGNSSSHLSELNNSSQVLAGSHVGKIVNSHLFLKVPMFHLWADMPTSRWLHVQAKILYLPADSAENHTLSLHRWAEASAGSAVDPDPQPGRVLSSFSAAVRWGADKIVANVSANATELFGNGTSAATTNAAAVVTESFNGTALDPHRRLASTTSTTTSEKLFSFSSLIAQLSSQIDYFSTALFGWFNAEESSGTPVSIEETEEEDMFPRRRRLEDTYGQSLVHVNRLYTKAFGSEGRKVPAHVPHMIDKDYMDEMQERWPEQWNATSSHRFRSSTDMQYSFSYYYYLSNRIKVKPHDLTQHVRTVLDTDRDGYLNANEFRTLAAMIKGSNSPSDAYLEELLDCIANKSATFRRKHREEVSHLTPRGKVVKSFEVLAHPTIAEALACDDIDNGLRQKVNWAALYPSHTHESDKDLVAFEMIGDNYTISLSQLDSVRQRQSKFVCINDNMKNPPKELEQALRNFYLSFFPEPCVFELPPGERNPSLYLDEYRRLQHSQGQLTHRLTALVTSLPSTCAQWVWQAARAVLLPVAQSAAELLSAEKDDTEAAKSSELYVNGLREEITKYPRHVRENTERQSRNEDEFWTSYHRGVLLLSVVGVVGFVVLRQLSRK